MPTKHIDEKTWTKIEKMMVEVVMETQRPIKDTEVLKRVIEKGLQETTKKDYKSWVE